MDKELQDARFQAVRACFIRYYNNVMELEDEAERTDMSQTEKEERLITLDNYFAAETLHRVNDLKLNDSDVDAQGNSKSPQGRTDT